MDFSNFEKEVIEKLLIGEDDDLKILREQYAHSKPKKRDCSEHGCFTYFSVSEGVRVLDRQDLQFGDVTARVEGLENGIGFILFITSGKIDFLESYTYGELFPKEIKKYEISYIGGKRDLAEIGKKFCS